MTPTPEMIAMARRIAAHALCGPEGWKPGVKAGMFDDIMKGLADSEALVLGPLTAIMELSAWKPMSDAPKDGTPILAVVAINDSRHLGHLAGRIFSIKHEGITAGRYDMGWAVYPGFGGCPDDYFAGWLPCPVLPSATGGHLI